MAPAPNIVFIFADQMRAQATGYAGDPNVKSPCLDRLSQESLVFTHAISTCPVCTPYRASLFTGQYPLTHGLFMNDLCLPDNGCSLAQVLKKSGYQTAYIGKWHLDGHGRTAHIPPERRQGFDDWNVQECTHNYWDSTYYSGNDPGKKKWDGYDAFAQTRAAVSYLEDQNASHPFALFLSFGPPHDPYGTAPEEFKALYNPGELVIRSNVAPHRVELARRQLQGYYAHITALDSCVETIDCILEKKGIKNNTILVFTSDHGDMVESQWQGSGQHMGVRKQCPYDESIRVPFLLRYPEQYGPRSRTIKTPIGTPDIMPTLLSMCGCEIPATVEGVDYTPVISGERKPERTGVLIASYHPFADWRTERGGRPYRGIRTERYTFVRDLNGPWMLFDNFRDTFQTINLVNKSACDNVQGKLEMSLQKMLRQRGDPFEKPEMLRSRFGYKVDDTEAVPF